LGAGEESPELGNDAKEIVAARGEQQLKKGGVVATPPVGDEIGEPFMTSADRFA